MIMTYLKDYTDTLLDLYAKDILKRELTRQERDIFYLKEEFYINKIINNAKDDISERVMNYVKKVFPE